MRIYNPPYAAGELVSKAPEILCVGSDDDHDGGLLGVAIGTGEVWHLAPRRRDDLWCIPMLTVANRPSDDDPNPRKWQAWARRCRKAICRKQAPQ